MPFPLFDDDRYAIRSHIGRGASADVYLAKQCSVDRLVAIKVMRDDAVGEEDRERHLREARLVASLRHPNIVTLYDVGTFADGRPYMVMEYVPDRTLSKELRNKSSVAPARAVHLFDQICAGLAHAHAQGIIHRDIKPGNVLIESQLGGPSIAKLTDFGVAKTPDSEMTRQDTVLGTPMYMAPELFVGREATVASDIYAMGVLMYRTLTGRHPFYGENAVALATQHIKRAPEPFGDVCDTEDLPPELERAVLRCLEKEPQDRYLTVQELRRDLAQFRQGDLGHLPTSMLDTNPHGQTLATYTLDVRTTRHMVRSVAVMSVGVSLIVTLLVVGVLALILGYGRPPATQPAGPAASAAAPRPQPEVSLPAPRAPSPAPTPTPSAMAPRAQTAPSNHDSSRPSAPPADAPVVAVRARPAEEVAPAAKTPAVPPTPSPPEAAPPPPALGAVPPPSTPTSSSVLTGRWTGSAGGRPLVLVLEEQGERLTGQLAFRVGSEEVSEAVTGRAWSDGEERTVELETESGRYRLVGQIDGHQASGDLKVRKRTRATWSVEKAR